MLRWFTVLSFLVVFGSVLLSSPVQWQTSESGNGHWYEAVLVSSPISWLEADTAARERGNSWHLATITSEGENAFVARLAPEFPPAASIDVPANGTPPSVGIVARVDDAVLEDSASSAAGKVGKALGLDGLTQAPQASPTYWDPANGGNGHTYEAVLVAKGISWTAANAAATAKGPGWHLATITSAAENKFVFGLIGNNSAFFNPNYFRTGPWLGGYHIGPGPTNYRWVTAEPFTFSAWAPSEPFGNGQRIAFFGFQPQGGPPSSWDDIRPEQALTGYILEVDEPCAGVATSLIITTQPINQKLLPGSDARFSVIATSPSALRYQWRFDGANIPNETNATLVVKNVQPINTGKYSVAVSNCAGSVPSVDALLTISLLPVIHITSPTNGAVFAAGSNIPILAEASDPDGTVTKVGFYEGSNRIGTATNAPWSMIWSNVPSGSYTLTAKAVDSEGIIGVSGPVSVRVGVVPGPCPLPSGVGLRQPVGTRSVITFEGLPGMNFLGGTPIPGGVRLTSQLLSRYGTRFSSGGGYVPVVDLGPGHATSGTKGIGGSTATGILSYNTPIDVELFFPSEPTLKAVTDFVSVRADLRSDGGTVRLSAYDIDRKLLKSTSGEDRNGTTLTLSVAGIHSISVVGTGTQAFDDLTLGPLFALCLSPIIAHQPDDQRVAPGENASFSTVVDGSTPINVQWWFNEREILGATNLTLLLTNVVESAAGKYAAVVCNCGGSVITREAFLSVKARPTISIISPKSGEAFVDGANIPISAEATDPDGTVTLVGFYANGARIGPTFTNAPFIFVWTNAPLGTNALTAKAVDNEGGSATSESVQITVTKAECVVPVYATTFESDVGDEWSTKSTAVTPAGARRFLGLFGNDNIQLGLTNLPPHSQGRITFDLYLKDSWDGNEGSLIGGPDRWSLSVQDGPTLLDTTFSLLPDFCNCQAYPDNYPDGNHPGRTGAVENNTLGYTFEGPMDAVYHLNFTFPHTAESVVFDFLANRSSPTTADESWGIDNVLVEVDAPNAPQIVSSPLEMAVPIGSEVLFTVEAKYASSYQWLFEAVPLIGATNTTLLLTNVQLANVGSYTATVSNCVGSITSGSAQLNVVTPPTISAIPDQATLEDIATAPIPFTIGDAETPVLNLIVTFSSSNPALVPNGNIAPAGSGADRTLIAVPARDQFGDTTITATVMDADGATANSFFKLTVQPVNDSPTISTIPQQTTPQNTPTGPIPFVVSDIDTPLDKLVVTGQSSNGKLVPATGFAFSGAGANRTLVVTPAPDQFGTSTNTVTVSDGEATASTSFTLEIVMKSSVVLTKPSDRASYCPNSNVEIAASVGGLANLLRVEFYAGTSLLGSDESAPFTYAWENVTTGDYSLTARAIDDGGNITLSEPVQITVSQLCGTVAIVRPDPDPEIDRLQDYLFEMGIASDVFDAATVTTNQLLPYQLVIWHGQAWTAIDERLVKIFQDLQESKAEPHSNGMPLYFIGEYLGQSSLNLSLAGRSSWARLTRLAPGNGRAENESVQIEPAVEQLLEPILRGRFGHVESFRYTNRVDLATAEAEGQLYGFGLPSTSAVLVGYPRIDNSDDSLPLTFAQTCSVTTGGDAVSVVERKKIFQNVICFLLGTCPLCHTLSLSLDMSGPSEPVQVGDIVEFGINVQQNGECEAIAVVVTVDLPDGLQCIGGESEQGTFECDGRTPIFNIGHMQSASRAEMKLTVKALRPGTYSTCATARANNVTIDSSNQDCFPLVVEGAVLSLKQLAPGQLELKLEGQPARSYTIQRSKDLWDWTDWRREVHGPSWTEVVPVEEPGWLYRVKP